MSAADTAPPPFNPRRWWRFVGLLVQEMVVSGRPSLALGHSNSYVSLNDIWRSRSNGASVIQVQIEFWSGYSHNFFVFWIFWYTIWEMPLVEVCILLINIEEDCIIPHRIDPFISIKLEDEATTIWPGQSAVPLNPSHQHSSTFMRRPMRDSTHSLSTEGGISVDDLSVQDSPKVPFFV